MGYEAGLHLSSTPEIKHGTSHLEDGTCIWVQWVLPLAQRWAARGELSLLLMEAGEEKAGPLYAFFPKMRCGGQSCQNGCPSPKWMAGE